MFKFVVAGTRSCTVTCMLLLSAKTIWLEERLLAGVVGLCGLEFKPLVELFLKQRYCCGAHVNGIGVEGHCGASSH